MDTDIYYTGDVDLEEVVRSFEEDENNMSSYRDNVYRNYDTKRALWAGKSDSFKKEADDAFPWQGSSDHEVRLAEYAVESLVAICMNAYDKATVRCQPVEGGDIRKSRIVTSFVRWMRDSLISSLREQMERAANNLFDNGMCNSVVDWEERICPYIQEFDIEKIAAASMELAEMILNESLDDKTVSVITEMFDGVDEKEAKKVINQLRKTGTAELPYVDSDMGRPTVITNTEVIVPKYCTDIQSAPRIHVRTYMTPAQIESSVANQGWDKDWAEYVIENCLGDNTSQIHSGQRNRTVGTRYNTRTGGNEFSDLVEVIFTYRRLFNKGNGSEGIYHTIYCPKYKEAYAKHGVSAGRKEYPVVMTRLDESTSSTFDSVSIPEKLRSAQMQCKNTRDDWLNAQAVTIHPTLLHPVGRPPAQYGAGAYIGRRMSDQYEFLSPNVNISNHVQIEEYIQKQALKQIGLDMDDPVSRERLQFYVNKFLSHCSRCLKMSFATYIALGSEEVYFRVTGSPETEVFRKKDFDTEIDVLVKFDVQINQEETITSKIAALRDLKAMDVNNRVGTDELIEIAANMVDPILADYILKPIEQSEQEVIDNIGQDLSKIFAGFPVNARTDGSAQIALQILEGYLTNPSIAQRLQTDPVYAEMIGNYKQQYESQLQQMENASIGRAGGEINDFNTGREPGGSTGGAIDTQAGI